MSSIAENISRIKSQIPAPVRLVAVSKTRPAAEIMMAYDTGHRIFGENRVQELLGKKDKLPGDIEWHLIGHLQTNKAKHIVPFISMIQSVDSFRLLKVINDEAAKVSRIVDCLLQVHIAAEETKFGFSADEINEMLSMPGISSLRNVRICGVMGMATFTDDERQVRTEFSFLRQCFEKLRSGYFSGKEEFREVSMGMSGDYLLAVEEGSTMIRVGSLIFGERN